MSRLRIMAHAVERYQKRWAPHLSTKQARRELERIAQGARPEKLRTPGGQERWVADTEQKITFVVKRDARTRERVCVTVLPEGAGDSIDVFEDFASILQEEEAEREAFRQRQAQQEVQKIRDEGIDCQRCTTIIKAVRYSRKFKQRWCQQCYDSMKASGEPIGKCPTLEEYANWLALQVTS